jgi:hypothetical protein
LDIGNIPRKLYRLYRVEFKGEMFGSAGSKPRSGDIFRESQLAEFFTTPQPPPKTGGGISGGT